MQKAALQYDDGVEVQGEVQPAWQMVCRAPHTYVSRRACKVTDPAFGRSSALGPRLLDAQPKAAAADLHFTKPAQSLVALTMHKARFHSAQFS